MPLHVVLTAGGPSPALPDLGAGAGLDTALTTALLLLAAAVLVRPLAAGVLLGAGLLPGRVGAAARALAPRVAPLLLRRALLARAAVGGGAALASVVAPLAATAAQGAPVGEAAGVGAPSRAGVGAGPGAAGSGLPNLDRGPRPVAVPAPASPGTARSVVVPTVVVVQDGDCLWSIAARHLPPGASDAEVDRAWRELYRANRAVVGADPDVVVPGQRLVLPASLAGHATPVGLEGGRR